MLEPSAVYVLPVGLRASVRPSPRGRFACGEGNEQRGPTEALTSVWVTVVDRRGCYSNGRKRASQTLRHNVREGELRVPYPILFFLGYLILWQLIGVRLIFVYCTSNTRRAILGLFSDATFVASLGGRRPPLSARLKLLVPQP